MAILPILPRFLLFAVIASWKCPLLKIVLLQENLQKLAAAVAEIEERDATQIEWEIKAEEIWVEFQQIWDGGLQQISGSVHKGAGAEERG